MDERVSGKIATLPSVNESLNQNSFVYRICFATQRDSKNKMCPAIRNFTPSKNDTDGLSVDWEMLTTPEESIARFGAQYKYGKIGVYKEYKDHEIYKLFIEYIKQLPDITDVIYSPIRKEHPPKGAPNNLAHSSITFTKHPLEDECETLLRMRDHAIENLIVPIDMNIVDKEVSRLREQGD